MRVERTRTQQGGTVDAQGTCRVTRDADRTLQSVVRACSLPLRLFYQVVKECRVARQAAQPGRQWSDFGAGGACNRVRARAMLGKTLEIEFVQAVQHAWCAEDAIAQGTHVTRIDRICRALRHTGGARLGRFRLARLTGRRLRLRRTHTVLHALFFSFLSEDDNTIQSNRWILYNKKIKLKST